VVLSQPYPPLSCQGSAHGEDPGAIRIRCDLRGVFRSGTDRRERQAGGRVVGRALRRTDQRDIVRFPMWHQFFYGAPQPAWWGVSKSGSAICVSASRSYGCCLAASLSAVPLLTDFTLRKTSHLSRRCYLEDRLISAYGPKRTSLGAPQMSAFRGKSDKLHCG